MDSLIEKLKLASHYNWTWQAYDLQFKRPAKTSRDTLHYKRSWFLKIRDGHSNEGIGECSTIEGLSVETGSELEGEINQFCTNPSEWIDSRSAALAGLPALRFAFEMALNDFESKPFGLHFPSAFTNQEVAMPINGLIWMGDKTFMRSQIIKKIEAGFDCIKLKIGGIDSQDELDLLAFIRNEFARDQIELRLDANGAFTDRDPLEKLKLLSQFDIHSIEQPIKKGVWDEMAKLCSESPIGIALDEELIGISDKEDKKLLLETIRPQYIILKPSLIGGWAASDEWIDLASSLNISYWATSALESNIGLNAISQWIFTKGNPIWQGLGTGGLYTNNIDSPLTVSKGRISYQNTIPWNLDNLEGRWHS